MQATPRKKSGTRSRRPQLMLGLGRTRCASRTRSCSVRGPPEESPGPSTTRGAARELRVAEGQSDVMFGGLLLTNHGSATGWAIVLVVCAAVPAVLGLLMRWRDRRRR